MFISKASSFFVIQSDHILQAHQIYDYSHEHEDTSKITTAVRKLIKYIILTYSEKSQKTSFRSISKSRFVKFIKYFEDWIIIKSARQAAFRKFKEQINHYRQHSIFLKYLHTRHSERSIRSDHDKDIDRKHIESVNEKFFKFISQRKEKSLTSIMTSEIQNAINETIRQYVTANLSISEFAEFSESAELSVSAVSSNNSRWNAAKVDFFGSLYDEKSISIEQIMKHANKNTYFRDVHLFIERARNIATIHENQNVRDNLFTSFRESALQCYTSKISSETKQLIRYEKRIDHWTTQLLKWFKKITDVSMNIILRERYTMNDARRRRKSRKYAAKILRTAKSAELKSMTNQIAIIYNDLDVKFRRNLIKSFNVFSIDLFLREMNDVKEIWWQLIFRNNYDNRREYQSSRQRSESFVRAYTFYFKANISYNNQRTSYFNAQYQSYNMKQSYYLNKQQFYQSKKKTQSQLSSSKLSLIIINTTSASQSIYSIKYNQSSNRYENRQNKQKTYQTTVENEENDQFMKNEETVSINFAEYDEHENELYYDEQTIMKKNSDEVFVEFIDFETICKHCHKVFSFNNKLHHHLRHDQCIKKFIQKNDESKIFAIKSISYAKDDTVSVLSKIIESTISIKDLEYNIDFRNWNFLKALVRLFITDFDTHVCINTKCETTLKNKLFVKNKCFNVEIHIMTSSLWVRNIDATTHETNEYVKISVYFSEIKKNKQVLTCVTREIHLVKDFKTNLLIENDFLKFEDFVINISNKKITIISCDVTIDLFIKQREFYVKRNIHAIESIFILSESEIDISVSFSVFKDRDFFFESFKKIDVTLFHHIVDFYFNKLIVRNDFSKAVQISKNFCLESITKIIYDDCFQVTANEIHRAMKTSKFTQNIDTMFTSLIKSTSTVTIKIKKFEKEFKLSNKIMTYENSNAITIYTRLINKFSTLWVDENFIDISKNNWMKFSLQNDWQSIVNDKFKVYSLRLKNQKIVNDIFDEFHKKERLKWTISSTFFSYLVFVTWRTINKVRKDWIVIDIRELNKLFLSDAYSLSLQSDIISNLQKCTHIFVLDAIFFFYQWRTHSNDIYKQTVVTFRDQKTFLISVMNNRNSISSVQRQMNHILREVRHFAKAFIDDIVIRSRSFNEHLAHFREVFTIFSRFNRSIKSTKVFFDYSDVILLSQRIDVLNLFIIDEKLKTIADFKFSNILKNLKHYLDLTNYIRDHIYYYSAIAKSLQNFKTTLLKTSSDSDIKRKTFTSKMKILFIKKKMQSFEILQKVLSKFTMFYHFVASFVLWIDFDTFKKFDIDVIVFHFKDDVVIEKNRWFFRIQILFVMFLSRQLTSAELNYWLTKLEISKLI